MHKGLLILIPILVIGLVAFSLSTYFNLQSGRSVFSNPVSFKGFENCMRDIAETIPRYKNAKNWDIKSNSSQVGLDGSASARIEFTTVDSEKEVFTFYQNVLAQDGWKYLNDSIYQFSTTSEDKEHSLTFQKRGVIYLTSP